MCAFRKQRCAEGKVTTASWRYILCARGRRCEVPTERATHAGHQRPGTRVRIKAARAPRVHLSPAPECLLKLAQADTGPASDVDPAASLRVVLPLQFPTVPPSHLLTGWSFV
ncbi:hypothetical protein WMY93_022031 [Mugilogobius chulae]|uniref:Uncharacterized protein n=1 Tax=Mugilogobius chulae TaxID=88201 RepID=A0AAW0NGP0_9GOBI